MGVPGVGCEENWRLPLVLAVRQPRQGWVYLPDSQCSANESIISWPREETIKKRVRKKIPSERIIHCTKFI